MMNPNFLRSAEFYKRRYHNFASLLIIPFVCFIAFIFVFLCYAKKEIIISSTGEITPTTIVTYIQSTSDSTIVKNNLTDNTAVKKGDLLVTYSEDASPERQSEQESIIKERKDREKKKNKKKKKEQSKSSKDESEIKKVSIFASDNGVINTDPKYENVNIVPLNTEMAQLYPEITEGKKIHITYYVSSEDVLSMKKGQVTRLSLEKKGNDKVLLEGKIITVASSATTTKQGNLFKITAEVKLSKKDAKLVKYGMTGKTVTVIAKKTYFDYFKDKLLHKMEN